MAEWITLTLQTTSESIIHQRLNNQKLNRWLLTEVREQEQVWRVKVGLQLGACNGTYSLISMNDKWICPWMSWGEEGICCPVSLLKNKFYHPQGYGKTRIYASHHSGNPSRLDLFFQNCWACGCAKLQMVDSHPYNKKLGLGTIRPLIYARFWFKTTQSKQTSTAEILLVIQGEKKVHRHWWNNCTVVMAANITQQEFKIH